MLRLCLRLTVTWSSRSSIGVNLGHSQKNSMEMAKFWCGGSPRWRKSNYVKIMSVTLTLKIGSKFRGVWNLIWHGTFSHCPTNWWVSCWNHVAVLGLNVKGRHEQATHNWWGTWRSKTNCSANKSVSPNYVDAHSELLVMESRPTALQSINDYDNYESVTHNILPIVETID